MLQSIAMALAAALHHSASLKEKKAELQQNAALRGQNTGARAREGEVHEKNDAPQRQNTPHPGQRPGTLAEPRPQRSDRSMRRSSGEALPTLGLPLLAGASGEAVDSSALGFLTAQALEEGEAAGGGGRGSFAGGGGGPTRLVRVCRCVSRYQWHRSSRRAAWHLSSGASIAKRKEEKKSRTKEEEKEEMDHDRATAMVQVLAQLLFMTPPSSLPFARGNPDIISEVLVSACNVSWSRL